MDNCCVGALIDHRQGKVKRSNKNLSSVILCIKKPRALAMDRNRASVIRGRRHIAWVMLRPRTDLWNRNLLTFKNKLYDRCNNERHKSVCSGVHRTVCQPTVITAQLSYPQLRRKN